MRLRPEFVLFMSYAVPAAIAIIVLGTGIVVSYLAWGWVWFVMRWFIEFFLNFILVGCLIGVPIGIVFSGIFFLHVLAYELVFENDTIETAIGINTFRERFWTAVTATCVLVGIFVYLPESLASCYMNVKLSDLSEEFMQTSGCRNYSVYADDSIIDRRNVILQNYGFSMIGSWHVVNPGDNYDCEKNARGIYLWTGWSIQ